MSESTPRSDPPAVVGGARQAALESLARYRALGAATWAEEQANKDARESIQCIKMFMLVHRLTPKRPDDVTKCVDLLAYYRDLWMSGRFVPMAKWATAAPLARMAGVKDWVTGTYVHNDPPPQPDWLPIGTSPLAALFPTLDARWVKTVFRTRLNEQTGDRRPTRRARDLAWSLLGSKAMFPSLWVDQVGANLKDHAQLLGNTPPPPLTRLAQQVIQVVAESISLLSTPEPIKYSSLPRPRLSSSAGWVKMFDQEAQRWTTMQGTRAAQFSKLGGTRAEELVHMDYRPWAGVTETRGVPYAFDWSDWDFDPKVSVVALQEPFKIRTISIADGPATAAASPIQRVLHSTLKGLSPFRLIGGKRVEDSAREVFIDWDANPFVSGDYSAATDRLSIHASRLMLRGLMKRIAIEPQLRTRIERSLLGANMDYSRTLETFRGRVPDEVLDAIPLPPTTAQANGQLMGNILSFPILCLVNLSSYIYAIVKQYRDVDQQSWTFTTDFSRTGEELGPLCDKALRRGYFTPRELNDLPVLINGDDILFQASRGLYEKWLSTINIFGFKPSVGKNYYSDEFFTVNSELYTRDGFRSRPWWGGFQTDLVRARQEIRFELGVDVLQADMRRVLPPMQQWLRETVPTGSWPATNRLWITHLHDSGLLEPYSGLNWFLPTELGGMGLDDAGYEGYDVTYAQKKLAVRLALNPEGFRFPGSEGSLVTARADATYRKILGSVTRTGELVVYKGVKGVLDRVRPMAVRVTWGERVEVMARFWPLVTSLVQSARHIDRWLDHHTDGVRLDAGRVRDGVRRGLHWGLKMSDKHLAEWGGLDVQPRYNCGRLSQLVPVRLISSA